MDTRPTFPLDLEREMFEATALMYPKTIPALLRVARRVLIWIEPSDALLRATQKKPPSFFRAVRRLLLDSGDWDPEQTRNILKLCTGVVDFSVIGDISLDPTFLPILAAIPLRRLCAELYPLFTGYDSIDFTHPMFASLTHLDALDCPHRICPQVPLLPALTHLGLDRKASWDTIETVLAKCSRLELLIVSFPEERESSPEERESSAREWAGNPPINDVRFVVGLYGNYVAEWEAGGEGFSDFWSLADDFVARKRRREIDGKDF
ncbi:hypothetical protein FB451DRAFT_1567870 [Mycena latifolia]|nr:hypothetical protein FB451DRAFT_1567870 [Mycena latifolia]